MKYYVHTNFCRFSLVIGTLIQKGSATKAMKKISMTTSKQVPNA